MRCTGQKLQDSGFYIVGELWNSVPVCSGDFVRRGGPGGSGSVVGHWEGQYNYYGFRHCDDTITRGLGGGHAPSTHLPPGKTFDYRVLSESFWCSS